MNSLIDTETLENEFVQYLLTEVVHAALDTPLRNPILTAVEESNLSTDTPAPITTDGEQTAGSIDESIDTDDGSAQRDEKPGSEEEPIEESIDEQIESQETAETGGKSKAKMLLQGGTVFVLMFVVLYTVLKHLTNDEDA